MGQFGSQLQNMLRRALAVWHNPLEEPCARSASIWPNEIKGNLTSLEAVLLRTKSGRKNRNRVKSGNRSRIRLNPRFLKIQGKTSGAGLLPLVEEANYGPNYGIYHAVHAPCSLPPLGLEGS